MPVLSESHPKSQIPKECNPQSQRCVPRKQAFRWLMVRGEEQGRAFHGEFNLEKLLKEVQFSSVQSLSRVWLFATPWTAACQASLFITNSWSLLKLMSIESVMPSNHLILCRSFSSCLQSFPASVSFPMHQVAKVLEFQLQHRSFQWIFRTDFLQDWLVGYPCSSRDSQESSLTPQEVQQIYLLCDFSEPVLC